MAVFGYVRASTNHQTTGGQRDTLRAAGSEQISVEKSAARRLPALSLRRTVGPQLRPSR